MSTACPKCGWRTSTKAPIDPNSYIIARPRICDQCGDTFVPPLPRLVGYFALLFATAIVVAVIWEAVYPPADWPFHGNILVIVAGLSTAWTVAWMGWRVLHGRTDGIVSVESSEAAGKEFGEWLRGHPIVEHAIFATIVVVVLVWWFNR